MTIQKAVIRNNIHGWLVLDKPAGISSNQALGKLKFLLKPAKVGHAGTLDPMASGLLPVAFGEATKTSSYLMDGLKIYRFTVKWGEETTTDDVEGDVSFTSLVRPVKKDIERIIDSFAGEIEQLPPQFSAIKVNGQRAYKIARSGKHAELQERKVRVIWLRLIGIPDMDHAEFEVKCGKGTYVRSLGRDIARKLDTFGHICELRRLSVHPFTENEMIPLKSIEKLANNESIGTIEEFSQLLRPIETVLDDIPALSISQSDAESLRKGQSVLFTGSEVPKQNKMVCVSSAGTLVGLAESKDGSLHPKRIFNFNRNQP